ncbi:MAG: IS3 family transposase [Clostridioides difficile]|nr:IS3 family transposase [Clostridioides difficile]
MQALCKLGRVSRAAYYKWLKRKIPENEVLNQRIAKVIKEIHTESPDKGYRRIRDDLERYHDIDVNDKRILRICRSQKIKSTIKYGNTGCTRQADNPQYLAENELRREFTADAPNEKWLTDVTEFKYYENGEKRKLYLSAILDLFDRRIVAFVIGDRNNNPLVFDTLDQAVATNPDAHPLFHSDRGFQYTNRAFHEKLETAGMKQSMSRVGKCIDNGPMEGFWGIIKRERYYGRKFTNRESLETMIESYIDYYNDKRLQRNLGVLTPLEKHKSYLAA